MKESFLNDAKVEAMLDQLKLTEPQMFCNSKHKIDRLCINHSCSTSLVCSQPACKCCGVNAHLTCPIISLEGVTHLLNERVRGYKDVIEHILKIDHGLINAIHQSTKQLISACFMGSIESKCEKILNQIYKKSYPPSMTGSQANQFVEWIQNKSNLGIYQKNNMDNLLQQYNFFMNKIIYQVQKMKQTLFQSPFEAQERIKINSYQCKTDCSIKDNPRKTMNSEKIKLDPKLSWHIHQPQTDFQNSNQTAKRKRTKLNFDSGQIIKASSDETCDIQ